MRPSRVLLVDDEPLIRASVGRSLSEAGYDVLQAASAEEAMPLLADFGPEVVVTDIVMAGMDGIGLLGRAKELDPETSVIVITGYADVPSAVQALRLGAEDYMTKPFDVEELLCRMARCLASREANRKLKLYEKIIAVCASCHKVRYDGQHPHGEGEWMPMERFFQRAAGVSTSHTYCPECAEEVLKTI